MASGAIRPQFEAAHSDALDVHEDAELLDRVLLVDDVCTEGSTLRTAVRRLGELNDECRAPAPACKTACSPSKLEELQARQQWKSPA